MENKGKHTKRRNPEKRKAYLAQRNQEKAHSNKENGLSTDVVEVQPQPRNHKSKAVARHARQGAPAPQPRPFRPSFGQLTPTAMPNVGVKVLARFNVPK